MTAVTTTVVPRTLAEHYAIDYPDDLTRELIDGTLIVSPGPRPLHGHACAQVMFALHAAAPPGIRIITTTNVDEEPATNLQPDVLVLRRSDLDLSPTELRPLLVVEVLSPSSRRIDPVLKRAVYERMGIPSYWIVDPDEPSLLVLELGADGRYAEVADAHGDVDVTLTAPYPLHIDVAALGLEGAT